MQCKYVESLITVEKNISAKTIDEFKVQFKELLLCTKELNGIVYIQRTGSHIPRLRGSSPIMCIGKTINSLHDRYNVKKEGDTYWTRYNYIIEKYGSIYFDLYKTSAPDVTENNFLYQYHQSFMELPPINLQSYKTNKL